MGNARLPPSESVDANAPLRLSAAAALAFPDGSMSASGLRKARDIEQIDIADALSIYLEDCGDDQADRKSLRDGSRA